MMRFVFNQCSILIDFQERYYSGQGHYVALIMRTCFREGGNTCSVDMILANSQLYEHFQIYGVQERSIISPFLTLVFYAVIFSKGEMCPSEWVVYRKSCYLFLEM